MKNEIRCPLALRGLVFLLIISVHSLLYAVPIDMNIQSGSSWLTSTSPGLGWTNESHNDSTWIGAYAPYPNVYAPGAITLPGTTADYMWHWDNNSETPNGQNGSTMAYFRYNFNLDLAMNSLPLIAQGFVAADDDFEFYVNGNLLLSSNLSTNDINPAHFIDFTSYLQNGDNVLAIAAQDTVGFYEWAFFDGSIKTVRVAEPGSLFLLGLGLLGIVASFKPRQIG